jgi:hypothetical protein
MATPFFTLLEEFALLLSKIRKGVYNPYWDWADPASNPFTPDFLGGAGTGPVIGGKQL